MKIALPSRGDIIDSHFDHCEYFTVFTINESEIIQQEIVPSPAGCGCKSNIASVLAEIGVSMMLAGNIVQLLSEQLFVFSLIVITPRFLILDQINL